MGQLTELLEKIRSMKPVDLVSRFKHLVAARGIREYLDAKPDINLNNEIRLIEEEIIIIIKKFILNLFPRLI